jgi:hypothetical protein
MGCLTTSKRRGLGSALDDVARPYQLRSDSLDGVRALVFLADVFQDIFEPLLAQQGRELRRWRRHVVPAPRHGGEGNLLSEGSEVFVVGITRACTNQREDEPGRVRDGARCGTMVGPLCNERSSCISMLHQTRVWWFSCHFTTREYEYRQNKGRVPTRLLYRSNERIAFQSAPHSRSSGPLNAKRGRYRKARAAR